ncbi:MAG: nucleotide sugar dehydrogenase [Gammaproteobacteria bacterium]
MRKIAVVGLGYVGLPLTVAFAQQCKVIGFDKKAQRINELNKHYDHNHEISEAALSHKNLFFTHDPADLFKADFFIIAVPTPVKATKEPDLELLLDASKIVGKHLKKGDIVVFESTVYPGATEEDCVPVLEKASHLTCGVDFTVGYSPERTNPGGDVHVIENTVKIVSGQDEATLNIVAEVYGSIVKPGVYRAESIKVAEAAKVIENTQRDVNISLINEIALIFHRLGIDTTQVINAASTKWNFIPFKPGLVGGHCIGVDPYYLAHKAKSVGYFPDVILSGRRVNDMMGKFIAEKTVKNLIKLGVSIRRCRVAILGVTFKENCVDTRNSRVVEMIDELISYDVDTYVHDPVAPQHIVSEGHDIRLCKWEDIPEVDAIIIAVAHDFYKHMDKKELKEKLKYRGLIMDVKSILDPKEFKGSGIMFWRL